ncbi:hypothetical protein GH733_010771 [Mirounga leonina]|nr:hypothetical protein GH733_010771 [Mirounga leonina]
MPLQASSSGRSVKSTTCSLGLLGANISTQRMNWSWKMNCSASDWKAPLMCQSWSQGQSWPMLDSVRDSGKFLVEDLCFAKLAPEKPASHLGTDRFVLLVSGLGLSGGGVGSLLYSQLLVDVVTGQLGDEGNSAVLPTCPGEPPSHNTQNRDSINKAMYLTKKTQAASVEAVKMLDEMLLQLSTSVPTDVMPGKFDPTNYMFPQQPLHPCMFPLATAYCNLQLVPNSYQATIDGVRFLGTSGQNVSDIFQYRSKEDHVEMLDWTLHKGCFSPTAPTLGPSQLPSGNTPSFGSKIFGGPEDQRVLLVAVPDFSTAETTCLVSPQGLACQPVSFSGFRGREGPGGPGSGPLTHRDPSRLFPATLALQQHLLYNKKGGEEAGVTPGPVGERRDPRLVNCGCCRAAPAAVICPQELLAKDTEQLELIPEKKGLFLKHVEYEVSRQRFKSSGKRW